MCKIKSLKKLIFWNIILITIFGLFFSTEKIWGNCLESYPESDVTAKLNAIESPDCNLREMAHNYGNLIAEKQGLIISLRTTYVRKLNKRVTNNLMPQAESIDRLKEYDSNLNKLSSTKKALLLLLDTAFTAEAENNGGIEMTEEMKNKLKAQLINCKKYSQALKKYITWANDEITTEEKSIFCKLDFYFRVCENFNEKFRSCL